jgi:hypothetical protein
VRETLISDSPIRSMTAWGLGRRSDEQTIGWSGSLDDQPFMRHDDEAAGQLTLDWTQQSSPERPFDNASSPASRSILTGEQLPIMRVVGQVGAAYIISEGPDGLFLIDQHAAHERILYEQFMAEWDEGQMTAQSLMAGTAVHLAPSQATLLEDNLELLAHLGHDGVVDALIAGGAPLDHVNNLGWTALIEAVILGDGGPRHTATVRSLLAAGADKSIGDRAGITPLQHAERRGYQAMVALLR